MEKEISTSLVALLSALGGAGATAIAVFFLKDFFVTTKKDLRELTQAVTALVQELKAATRDLRKIEGVIEGQQGQLTSAIEKIADSTANIKALWAALQNLKLVDKRMSDRG